MRALRIPALIFCTLTTVFAQAPAQDWRFAHPGATLVGSFRVKAMLESPLVKTLISEAVAKDPSHAFIAGMVLQGLEKVSDVRFSVRDMGKGKNPDVLALITGQLDEATLSALAKNKAGSRRIDANTLLVGEGPSLEEAVLRMSKPATGLQARALESGKTVATHDLWLAGSIPEMPMTVPVLDSLRGLALGISAQSDLRIELALETADAKTAEDLVSVARRSQTQQPALGAALQSSVDGSTARFRFVMEGNQVIQAMQQAIAGSNGPPSLAGLLGQSPSASAPAFREAAVAPKPQRETIRIYGLEDGPREIKPEPRQ
jgi:hypothetical protein